MAAKKQPEAAAISKKSVPGYNAGAVSAPKGSFGYSGLNQYSGFVNEEFLKEMQGEAGVRLLTEMADNHPVIGGFLYAIFMLVRQVSWTVESPTDRPGDMEAADFVSSCLDDMQFSWQDTLSEILSFLIYGFAFHEICYKPRRGFNRTNPFLSSRYEDNKIGWQKIQGCSQDSLYRWEFDSESNVLGMYQHVITQIATTGDMKPYERYIPMDKAMLFRTRSFKNNPHGKSIIRNAAVPYLRQRKIEEVECIGIERDLAGFPVISVPGEIMQATADDQQKATYAAMVDMVKKIKRDSAEGVVMPSDPYVDAQGSITNLLQYKLELLSANGQRQFDTTAILKNYDARIAMVVLGDFLLLGHNETGARSLGDTKTNMFMIALKAILEIICENFNRKAIPDLLRYNGYDTTETPLLQAQGLDELDLTELANFIRDVAAAGMPLFPDIGLENHLRKISGLPEASLDTARDVGTGSGDRINDPAEQQPQNPDQQAEKKPSKAQNEDKQQAKQ